MFYINFNKPTVHFIDYCKPIQWEFSELYIIILPSYITSNPIAKGSALTAKLGALDI